MPHLHEMLGEYEARLRHDWSRAISCEADAAPDTDAEEGFSRFLTELGPALRAAALGEQPPPPEELAAEESPGRSLDPVQAIRAFGLVHTRIVELAGERGLQLSALEHRVLVSHVGAAIARAVAGQTRAHERDLHRLAHQLRNPLGSAMMALTLLRSRVDFGDSARLAELAERNLEKLRGLIDAAVDEPSSSSSTVLGEGETGAKKRNGPINRDEKTGGSPGA